MSVRDRIQSFESINKESGQKEQGKRFFRPGKQSKSQSEDATSPLLPQTRSKPSLISELDADLQGIWSVRRNIHHSSNPSSNGGPIGLGNSQKIQQQTNPSTKGKLSQSYSRHGAMPASQSSAPHVESRLGSIGNRERVSPLQEHNHESRSWNLRTRGFSYSDAMKRPSRSPTGQSPAVKRKSDDKLCNGDAPFSSPHHYFTRSQDQSNRKLNYAQRMATGYMRSVGIGKYTPSEPSYSKEEKPSQSKSPHWKRYDEHDEFNFD